MKKIIIRDRTLIPPFNEPARELRVINKPLWLHQRDVLSRYCQQELEVRAFDQIPRDDEGDKEILVYRDNLFFDEAFMAAFMQKARARKRPCRVAFSPEDVAIVNHALPLQDGIHREGGVLVTDMWYFPDGVQDSWEPLVIDTLAREVGYYHIPNYMAKEKGDLIYYIPLRAFLSVENWVHVFLANSPFGIFSIGARVEARLDSIIFLGRILLRSLLERKQILSNSLMVKVGKNTDIDPTAVVQGPSIIGDNVTIGPGAVVTNSIIGSNVNIMQGCQVHTSVVGDGAYLPFRASLFMTTLMENAMVAQNTCLQLCVVGRDSFIGAGNTFTDFNLLDKPLRTMHKGKLQEVGMLTVLGGCVGHNCRIGSGVIVYPARTIESDVVLFAKDGVRVIAKNISYEESDHHNYPGGHYEPKYRPEQMSHG